MKTKDFELRWDSVALSENQNWSFSCAERLSPYVIGETRADPIVVIDYALRAHRRGVGCQAVSSIPLFERSKLDFSAVLIVKLLIPLTLTLVFTAFRPKSSLGVIQPGRLRAPAGL
jgi:hypothetical protein